MGASLIFTLFGLLIIYNFYSAVDVFIVAYNNDSKTASVKLVDIYPMNMIKSVLIANTV